MKNNKIALVFLLTAIAINSICFTGVFSYLSDKDSADNVMTVGSNSIKIIEEFIPPDKLEPGVVIPKKVNVENTGETPCVVRVSAEYSCSDMGEIISMDIDTEHWEYRDDGYYYYNEVLGTGDITHTLFNTLTVSDTADPIRLGDFELMVYAESRHAEKTDDYSDIKW